MDDEDGHGLVLDLGVGDEALDFAGALIHGDELVVAGGLVETVGDGGGILGHAGEGQEGEEEKQKALHGGGEHQTTFFSLCQESYNAL